MRIARIADAITVIVLGTLVVHRRAVIAEVRDPVAVVIGTRLEVIPATAEHHDENQAPHAPSVRE